MLHLVTLIRPHRTPGRNDVRHEAPVEDLVGAVALAKQQMRDNYADPLELQNEDRTILMDKAALLAEVNK
jgi:hypothetical protein